VSAHAIEAGSRLGCTPALSFDGELDALPAELAADVGAVAAEMLANVVRHSYAGSFALSLRVDGSRVVLEVRDDGVGPNDEPSAGTGIPDMTARAERYGGTYAIEPNEDAFGSRQRWDVPR
jgi:signal transduction histidine kinase